MNYQERYDELDNIVSSINILIDEISDKNYIGQLELIKYEAQNELDEVAEKLQEEQNREERQREKEYWEEAI